MKTIKTTALTLLIIAAAALGTMAFTHSGGKQVYLQVTHEVKNFNEWKKAFDGDKANREKAGILVSAIYTSAENANMVTVSCEVPSINVAKAFLNDPNLKAAMEKAGVISAPEVRIMIRQQ